MPKTRVANMVLQTLEPALDGPTIKMLKVFIVVVDQLIRLHEKGLPLDLVSTPVLITRLDYSIEGYITEERDTGIEGNIAYGLIGVGGKYGVNTNEAARLKIDFSVKSLGEIELDKLKAMTPEDWRNLIDQTKDTLARMDNIDLILENPQANE